LPADRVRTVAATHNASVAQVAIAWLLAKDAVSSVLLGASKPAQLADNLGAADLRLSDDEIGKLDAATVPAAVYPNWFIDGRVDQPAMAAVGR
jgi:aryl-alcohol dehydrogenase-like predicted oxidoreductase